MLLDERPKRLDRSRFLVGGELGDGLGSLGDGVLGELTRKSKSDGGLDLAAGERLLFVVSGKFTGFVADALEDVVDERVHDRHSALGDTGVRVHLFQHLVDVGGVRLDTSLSAGGAGLLGALSGFLGRSFGHFVKVESKKLKM